MLRTGEKQAAKRAVRAAARIGFAALPVLAELAARAAGIDGGPAWSLAVSGIGSVALWLACIELASSRLARAAIASGMAGLVVVEAIVLSYYRSFVDEQVMASARFAWGDVRPIVMGLLPRATVATAALAALGFAWLSFAAPRARPSRARVAWLFAIGGLGALLGGSLRHAPPDLRLLGALRARGGPTSAHAATRASLPPLPSPRRLIPDVLFVLGESVRASDYCSAPSSGCVVAPEVDALLPDRVPLEHLHAVASYTAVSFSALVTGEVQVGPADELLAAPSIFSWARAVRFDGQPIAVAYDSAQSESLLDGRDVKGEVDSLVTLETLLGQRVDDEDAVSERGVDRLLAARLEGKWAPGPQPRLIFLHLAGTHAPYFVDPARAPFAPFRHEPSWSSLDELHNAYKDAIVAQDHELARMIRAFIAAEGARPYLVFFTSDHGEAFGEHAAIHHGQSLYEEQIHVPGFVAQGNGALDDAALAALRAHRREATTHLDLVPTLLDAWGVLDLPALARARARWKGRSWLRPYAEPPPVPITNCTGLFPCPLDTWGVLGPRAELVAQRWDGGWRCVATDEGRELPLADPTCAPLLRASREEFPTLPNGRPNR